MKQYSKNIGLFAVSLSLIGVITIMTANLSKAYTESYTPSSSYRIETQGVKNVSVTMPDGNIIDLLSDAAYRLDMEEEGVDFYTANVSQGYLEVRLDTKKSFILTYTNDTSVMNQMIIKRNNYVYGSNGWDQTSDLKTAYLDLDMTPGSKVKLEISKKGVSKLSYDKKSDGKFEKTLKPTVIVKGAAADDFSPPQVTAIERKSNAKSTVTLNAEDPSGVGKIHYFTSTDGNVSPYGQYRVKTVKGKKAVIKNVSVGTFIYYLAEDKVGNRSNAGFSKYEVRGANFN